MAARALCMHQQARNVNESATQRWSFACRTDLPFVGVEFLVTCDKGSPADLEHSYAQNGLLGLGASDGIRHGSAVTAFESTGGTRNGWCYTTPGGCLTILDPVTGVVDGQAFVSATGNGEFWLTWTKPVPVGKEYTIAAMAFFGALRYRVVVGDTDVLNVPFIPRHLHVFGAYEGTSGPQNIGYLTDGYASRGTPIVQGSRSLTWNSDYSPIVRGYLSANAAYSDPAPGGGIDALGTVATFETDGWTIGGFGFQQHVATALGSVGPVHLKGGVVHWLNGTQVTDNPHVVEGCTGTPLFARSTFGTIATPDTNIGSAHAGAYGVGFVGDDGVGYCASLRMNPLTRECSSLLVRRMCDVERHDGTRLAMDWDAWIDGGMTYNLASEDVSTWRQVTQFVGTGVGPNV